MALSPVRAFTTPFPALMTPFPVNIFPNVEAPNVPSNIQKNLPIYLFISCFTILLTPSINKPKFSNDFMILIIFPYLYLK